MLISGDYFANAFGQYILLLMEKNQDNLTASILKILEMLSSSTE